MKKFLLIELVWFAGALVVAFSMGLLVLNLLGKTSYRAVTTPPEQETIVLLYGVSVLLVFISVYFMRFLAIGIGYLVKKDEEKEETGEK